MSTDLREAMRQAVTDAPPYDVDVTAVVDAGARRIRRRTRLAVSAGALATAAVVVITAVVSRPERRDPDPEPAEIEHVDLEDAKPLRPDVLASVRKTWDGTDAGSVDYDRFDAITDDGLVLRSRLAWADRDGARVGLLDPRNGDTDWLPALPGKPGDLTALSLDSERLVLAQRAVQGATAFVLDRASRTWQRRVVRVAADIEVHLPPRLALGPDYRVYVGATMEAESGPIHWWSAPLATGGEARPEPDLEGTTVVWADGVRVTASPDGRVSISSARGELVVADRPPDDCATLPDAPVRLTLAGYMPVVTYPCASGPLTIAYDTDPRREVSFRGVSAVAGDTAHLVLTTPPEHEGGPRGPASGTYVVNVARFTVGRLDAGPHDPQVALAAGLVLWNVPGPGDTADDLDVIWKVAPSSWLD